MTVYKLSIIIFKQLDSPHIIISPKRKLRCTWKICKQIYHGGQCRLTTKVSCMGKVGHNGTHKGPMKRGQNVGLPSIATNAGSFLPHVLLCPTFPFSDVQSVIWYACLHNSDTICFPHNSVHKWQNRNSQHSANNMTDLITWLNIWFGKALICILQSNLG